MIESLPEGWSVSTIQALAGTDGLTTDGDWVETKDQDPNGAVRLIQLADIGEGSFLDRSARYMNLDVARRLRCTFLRPGDLLIARMPDPLGRACVFPGLDQPAVTAVDVFVWRAGNNASDASWLMHVINSPDVRDSLNMLAVGTTRQRVSGGNLKRLELPVPPVAEQRRIVARIEALFARTRRARSDLQRVAPLAGRYFSATLAQAFQGTLTYAWRTANDHPDDHRPTGRSQGPYELPVGWAWCPLPSLGELARGKSRHRPRNHPALYGGPYAFIQTGDVRAARGRLRSFHQTYSEAGLAQSRLWPRDTLCITIAANIAETAILDIEACFPDSVVGFRAKRVLCSPEYIEYFFRTAKEDLATFAPATAQKNINLETLEAVLVPTPGLPEQAECVSRLSQSEAAVQVCENEASRALALLDRLEQSILARAFRGELVPQDPAETGEAPTAQGEDAPVVRRRRMRAVAA